MHKRKITQEAKIDAIEQVAAGKSVSEVAAAYEIVANTLYRWIREAQKDKPQNIEFAMNAPRPRRPIRTQRKFTETFKRGLAQQVTNGEPVAQVAAAFDVSKERIYAWVHQFFPEFKFD